MAGSIRDRMIMEHGIIYLCAGRPGRVAAQRFFQAMHNREYEMGIDKHLLLPTGSWAEGFTKDVCGDMDVMIINREFPVVLHEKPAEFQPCGYLIANQSIENPAFVTLSTVPGITYSPVISLLTYSGFLGSEVFTQMHGIRGGEIHGPAVTGPTDPDTPMMGMQDSVWCLFCPSWPPCASEFLTRPRHHGWPPQGLINKIKQAGCHVVPVGPPQSENKDIEWRWSFSFAEKELLHSVSDGIYMSLYVLKVLKMTNMLESSHNGQTIFCSYFIKTACLWVAEKTDQSNISMMDLCWKVIKWLKIAYGTHTLPHYFIPDQNLIKQLLDVQCRIILNHLENITEGQMFAMLFRRFSGNYIHDKIMISLVFALKNPSRTPKSLRIKERKHIFDSMIQKGTVGKLMKQEQIPAKMIELPLQFYLPFLEDLSNVVGKNQEDPFRTCIFIQIGDMYKAMFSYFKIHYQILSMSCLIGKQEEERSTKYGFYLLCVHVYLSIIEAAGKECFYRAETYFQKASPLVFPDGATDRGFMGNMNLALFYHLNKETQKLGRLIPKLKKLLEFGREVKYFEFPHIDKHETWLVLPWMCDTILHDKLIKPSAGRIYINPVILGYYIIAKFIRDTRDLQEPIRYQPSIFQAFCVWCEDIIASFHGSIYGMDHRMAESGQVIVELIDSLSYKG